MLSAKSDIRILTKKTLAEELFAEVSHLIALKVKHMERNAAMWEEYMSMIKLKAAVKSVEEADALLRAINDYERKMEAAELPLAFQTKCKPGSEEHWRFMQAAQYSDEWICKEDAQAT